MTGNGQPTTKGAASGFNAGFVDITPTHPLPLAGYGGRNDACAGVADSLEANIVIMTDGDQTLVVISFDLLYVGSLLRRKLEEALKPHIPPDNLFLAASHTHFTPATDPSLPHLGNIDPAFVDLVAAKVSARVLELLSGGFKPLKLGIGQAQANHAVNRRRKGWRLCRRYPFLRNGVWMRPNPRGPKDETIRVVRLGSDAVIWNYACHPVFVPRMNHVSADFVGVVRSAVRNQFGPHTACLFWQGFSGDTFPSFASALGGWRAPFRRLLGRPDEAVTGPVWSRWSGGLAQHVVQALAAVTPDVVGGPLQSTRITLPLNELLHGCETPKTISAQRLSIGADLHVLGISAEPAAEYGAMVRAWLGHDELFCVGCIDGVYGYLPTARMIAEGGYEAAEFLPGFSLRGRFSEDVEQIVKSRLLRVIAERAAESDDARTRSQAA